MSSSFPSSPSSPASCHGIMTMGKPERSLNLFTSLMPHSFAISDFATDSITAGALVILTFVCLS